MVWKWMAVLGIGLLAAPASAGQPQVLKTKTEKISHAVGVDTGRNLPTEDGLRSNEGATRNEKNLKLAAMKKRRSKTPTVAAEENKKAGEAFLAENRKKEGVVVLPTGLQYKVLKEGDGKIPTDGDTVDCFVRAMQLDNTVFGGSPKGKPSTFRIGESISGLNEALKLMPVGSKWRLFIPPELAFGEKGTRGRVGPNETLIYEVELLAVK